jgi:hypothetical protein
MNEQEYIRWCWRDTAEQIVPALGIYALALVLYWTIVA